MPKILFITAYTPASGTAGQNYTLHLLKDLAGKVEIDLVYFQYEDQKFRPANQSINVIECIPLSPMTKLLNAVTLPFLHPLFSARFSWSVLFRLRKLIRDRTYELIYFDFSQVFAYAAFLSGPKQVLMCHDVIYQKYSRQGNALERWWVRFSERSIFRGERQKIFAFSTKDVDLIRNLYGKEATAVNFFLSDSIRSLSSEPRFEQKTVCLFGAWNRPENHEGLLWLLKEVAPLIKETRFIVIGGRMPEQVAAVLRETESFTYLGFVEDPYPMIARCHALIAPLFKGAGVKVKVIEALACGTPVIGTPVALEGIPDAVRSGVIEVNEPVEFADAIHALRNDDALRQDLRNWFRTEYRTHTDVLLSDVNIK